MTRLKGMYFYTKKRRDARSLCHAADAYTRELRKDPGLHIAYREARHARLARKAVRK